jgi:predicted nucleic acid-binding protein
MAKRKLRVALDANVIIAGILLPRWPHEVMRASLGDFFDLVLPAQVIAETARHLTTPTQKEALQFFLDSSEYQELPMPSITEVRANLDLVRSEKDVPIAVALLQGELDIFVSSDKDFTDPAATAERFQARVRMMLPAVFLREVLGWSSASLEAIRLRTWADLLVRGGELGGGVHE